MMKVVIELVWMSNSTFAGEESDGESASFMSLREVDGKQESSEG